MSDTQLPDPVGLADQIADVRRELVMRRNVYPKWVTSGRLKQATADVQVARMEAVLATLERLAKHVHEAPADFPDYERLYGLGEGAILTADDAAEIRKLLDDANEAIGAQTDAYHDGYADALLTVSREKADLVRQRDHYETEAFASRGMDKMYEAMDALKERQRAQALIDCDWPADEPFRFRDEPGAHDPCYVVLPGGAMLALNHHAGDGVDIARARFIITACNGHLGLMNPDDEGAA